MGVDAVVAKLGVFLGERAVERVVAPSAEGAFSGKLARIRDELNHHVIPLSLLAHSDGDAAAEEHSVILNYCLGRAEQSGIVLSETEIAAFADYLRAFRPTRMQLSFAIKRLGAESKDEIMGLIGAAQALVDADSARSENEARFLANIQRELDAL